MQQEKALGAGEVPEQGQQKRGHDLGHVHAQDFSGKVAQGAQMINLAIKGIVLLGQLGVEQFDTGGIEREPEAGLKKGAQTRYELLVILVVGTPGEALFQTEHTILAVIERTDQEQLAFSGAEFALQRRHEKRGFALLAQSVQMLAQHLRILRSKAF